MSSEHVTNSGGHHSHETRPGTPRSAARADDRWHRLDPRSIATVGVLLAPLAPTVALMVLTGARGSTVLHTAGLWLVAVVLAGAAKGTSWYFTHYRIGDQRFELRVGNLSRSHKSIPRERIRSVDVTAQPAHRLFGLAVVTIGTGRQPGDGGEAKLDAVASGRAELLRRELLRHDALPSAEDTTAGSDHAGAEIARLRPAWLGYSALTASLAVVVWGGLASAYGSFSELLVSLGLVARARELVVSTPVWLTVTGAVLLLLVVGATGALVLSTEMWWAFRLTREPDRTLRVRRGLFTTRSVSVEERRLRGVEFCEPLLVRWAGGARLNAVATGLNPDDRDGRSDRKALLPPAPREEATRTAGAVLGAWPPPGAVHLARHPRAALRRRLVRFLAGPLGLVAGLAVTVLVTERVPPWVWVPVLLAPVVAAAFAVDAYRGLGHALGPRHLVTRRGTGLRRTVALERTGIIGWRVRRSLFQRWSGLATVSATTAVGAGSYDLRDVGLDEGLDVADRAVPGLLGPFLVRE